MENKLPSIEVRPTALLRQPNPNHNLELQWQARCGARQDDRLTDAGGVDVGGVGVEGVLSVTHARSARHRRADRRTAHAVRPAT